MKLVYMGSPELAAVVLGAIVEGGFRPSLVVTQPARPTGRGQELSRTATALKASELGIPVHETADASGEASLNVLREHAPDVILVAAFGQILKDAVLSLPPKGCFNVHASILPKYRGAAPVQFAIWNGDTETGVTIQKMVRKLDAGDILLVKKTPIYADETAGQLLERLSKLGGEAAVEALRLIEKNDVTLTPQNPVDVTFAPKIEKSQAEIDWNDAAIDIKNQIRALQPWPVAETWWGDTKLKIFAAEVVEREERLGPGEIWSDGKSKLLVGTGGVEALSLTEVQLENRKRLGIAQFLQGFQGVLPFPQLGKKPQAS